MVEPPIAPEGEGLREADTDFRAAQAKIANRMIWLLGGSIIIVAAMYLSKRWTAMDSGDIRDFAAIIIAPLIALIASVSGFYFGERRRS